MPRRTKAWLWVAAVVALVAAAGMRTVPANAPAAAKGTVAEPVPSRRALQGAASAPAAATSAATSAANTTSNPTSNATPAAAASARAAAPVMRPASSAAAGNDGWPAAQGRALGGSKNNAFGVMNWKPPPPPPPVAVAPAPAPSAPPPPPTAPPLPFVFVGMAERGADKPQAYLAKGSALLVVSVGDLIDGGQYRVDALGPSGVNLTYLPLNKAQTLSIP